MLLRLCTALLASVLVLIPGPVQGQTSRVEELELQRSAKAADLRAYRPGRIERILLSIEQQDLAARLGPRNGFFVRYGYRAKPAGAGIGLGGGYRHDLFDRRARVVGEAGFSVRKYNLLRADFSLPYLAAERLEFGVEASRRYDPQEDFYGTGSESLVDDRVNYRATSTAALARAVVKPKKWLSAGVHAGRLSTSIGSGTDSRYPSIELRFDDTAAPGLTEQPDFRYSDLFATVDYRDQPGNARAGGYYSLTFGSYADLDLDRYSFRRMDLHLLQFFPIFDKKRVFAVQGRVITSAESDGQTVPFYLQPTLGGSTMLRSVSDHRFRDDNVIHLNAEYRWEAFNGLDMALFGDAGKVTAKPGDLDLTDLTYGYGVGLRFNTYKTVLLRLDIGTGAGEGIRYVFKFSKAY